MFLLMLLTSLSSLALNGTIFFGNDEFKFFQLGNNDSLYSDEKIIRVTRDFLGYHYILHFLGSVFPQEIFQWSVKSLSIIAFTLGGVVIWWMFQSKLALVAYYTQPLLIYYGIIGVRDSLATALFIFFIFCVIKEKRTYQVICVLAAFFIRPELALILAVLKTMLLSFRFRSFAIICVTVLALALFPFIGHLKNVIQTTRYIKPCNDPGVSCFLRSLPFPVNITAIGFVGLSGTFLHQSTFQLDSAHEFKEKGLVVKNTEFVPGKILKALGIAYLNISFPFLVFQFYHSYRRILKKRASIYDQIFCCCCVLIFAQSSISTELGKLSMYHAYIYSYLAVLTKNRDNFLILFILGVLFFTTLSSISFM
jgi:hypothetical protein